MLPVSEGQRRIKKGIVLCSYASLFELEALQAIRIFGDLH